MNERSQQPTLTTDAYSGWTVEQLLLRVRRLEEIVSKQPTKRELFAAMAMQGLASNAEWEKDHNVNQTAREAIDYADALLKELAK